MDNQKITLYRVKRSYYSDVLFELDEVVADKISSHYVWLEGSKHKIKMISEYMNFFINREEAIEFMKTQLKNQIAYLNMDISRCERKIQAYTKELTALNQDANTKEDEEK